MVTRLRLGRQGRGLVSSDAPSLGRSAAPPAGQREAAFDRPAVRFGGFGRNDGRVEEHGARVHCEVITVDDGCRVG